MYYVGFSTATAVASLILFQGFNTTGATNTVSLLSGFAVTFLGVYLLNLSRQREPPLDQHGHSALEGGLMNPRLSLQGRMSLDGWNGDARVGPAPSPHGRRSSMYRNQTSTLFNAFEEQGEPGTESVGLRRLGEEDESEDDDDLLVDERTRLHKAAPPPLSAAKQSGSRSHSHSPLPSRPASTDIRIP